jgi:hypothetical protein
LTLVPLFFIVDLIAKTAINLTEAETATKLTDLQRAARWLLDIEKPAHTYYQLRIRNHQGTKVKVFDSSL